MGTGFLPFLYNSPASSDTCLFFTRMTTTPSGINVKLILSPVFMPRLSRMVLGNRLLGKHAAVRFVRPNRCRSRADGVADGPGPRRYRTREGRLRQSKTRHIVQTSASNL